MKPHGADAKTFDAAVIGAGVVGCAIARALAMAGARVAVLEKAADPLDGASKANSAILHTGFDAPENSLELDCIREGHAEYLEIREAMGLPLDRCGALVLAWSEAEEAKLPALLSQAHANGAEARMLTRAEILSREPQLSADIRAGFLVPGEALIDPWSAPHAYLRHALALGAEFLPRAGVNAARREGGFWRLDTGRGPVRARLAINAAGLYGDRVDALLLGAPRFEIRPRKGQFVVYDDTAARLCRHILLPVPTALTKGVVVCRTVWGGLLVGPTAEEQPERDRADLDPAQLEALRARGAAILPALAGAEVKALYAGLRPATEEKGYRIEAHAAEGVITAGGIRSTGLSAALGIAAHVRKLAEEMAGAAHGDGAAAAAPAPSPLPPPPPPPLPPRMPLMAETGAPEGCARDWRQAGNGGILCHCERVTRREAEAALKGPLPARSMAGLKRRTRIGMGRCQGFYCAGAVAALLRDHGLLPPPDGTTAAVAAANAAADPTPPAANTAAEARAPAAPATAGPAAQPSAAPLTEPGPRLITAPITAAPPASAPQLSAQGGAKDAPRSAPQTGAQTARSSAAPAAMTGPGPIPGSLGATPRAPEPRHSAQNPTQAAPQTGALTAAQAAPSAAPSTTSGPGPASESPNAAPPAPRPEHSAQGGPQDEAQSASQTATQTGAQTAPPPRGPDSPAPIPDPKAAP